MRFFFAAFAFLAAVAVFTFVAKEVYLSSVEEELRETAESALREAGFTEVAVAFDHHSARLGGSVVDHADRAEVRRIVAEAVPFAELPDEEELVSIEIRPTLLPELEIRRSGDERGLVIAGSLGRDREAVVGLLTSRLGEFAAVEAVEDRSVLDEKRFSFEPLGEFASVAVELFRHGGGERVSYAEGGIEISGEVPHGGIHELLLELADGIGGALADRIEVAEPEPEREPSELVLVRNRFGLSLAGRVGGEALLKEILDRAGVASSIPRLANRLSVDPSVASSPWEERLEDFLPPLLDLPAGEARLEARGDALLLAGRVPGLEKRRLLAVFEPLAGKAGLRFKSELESMDEAEPVGETAGEAPVRLVAQYQDGLLKLRGLSPVSQGGDGGDGGDGKIGEGGEGGDGGEGGEGGEGVGERLRERLGDRVPELLVSEEWTPDHSASGGSAGEWEETLLDFLEEALPRLESAEFRFESDRWRLEGIVREASDSQIVENAAFNAFGPVDRVENELALAEEPAQAVVSLGAEDLAALADALAAMPVYFAINTDQLDRSAREAVEEIATQLEEAGAPLPLVVTGFADSVGNPERNRQLSLQRAEAVKRALVEGGIERDRIELESKTLNAASIPRSERWKARRVEVSLRDPDPSSPEAE